MNRRVQRSGRTFVFLGLSGSGKGTQATRLIAVLGGQARNISTGAAFRRFAARKNLIGDYIRDILRRGALIPYWAPIYVWLDDFFTRLTPDEHLVFDGAPRRVEEARTMDDVMRDVGRSLPVAIFLKLSEAEADRRLLARGRADDHRRAIAGRFRFFTAHVRPVIEYYRRRDRLVTINGGQPVPAVWRDIRRALKLR